MSKAVTDFLERTVSTFLQALLSTLLIADPGLTHADWKQAALIALFATAISVVTSLIAVAAKVRVRDPYLDLSWRTGMTFIQTLLGVMIAAGLVSFVAFDWAGACRVAFAAAMAALLKGLIGLNAPTEGASTLVRGPIT